MFEISGCLSKHRLYIPLSSHRTLLSRIPPLSVVLLHTSPSGPDAAPAELSPFLSSSSTDPSSVPTRHWVTAYYETDPSRLRRVSQLLVASVLPPMAFKPCAALLLLPLAQNAPPPPTSHLQAFSFPLYLQSRSTHPAFPNHQLILQSNHIQNESKIELESELEADLTALFFIDDRTRILTLPPPPVLDLSPLPPPLLPQARLLASLLCPPPSLSLPSPPRAVLLSGPSGSGKSHVLSHFLATALPAGTPVLQLGPLTPSPLRLLDLALATGAVILAEWVDALPFDLLHHISIQLHSYSLKEHHSSLKYSSSSSPFSSCILLATTNHPAFQPLLPCFDEHLPFERTPHLLASLVQRFPATPWRAVGGLDAAKLQLQQSVVWQRTRAAAFRRLGVPPPSAVLLFGPPGCGKTLLAKATATEARMAFVCVSIPDVVKSYVGDSERALHALFQAARRSAPCVLFIDEIQAVFRARSSDAAASVGLISALLMAMDSLARDGVFLLGATNRPQDVDPSFLRPGRFDRLVYVAPPAPRARLEILRQYTRSMPLAEGVRLPQLAQHHTRLFTGSDLYNLCRHAAFLARGEEVTMQHFLTATYTSCTPSLTHAMLRDYERLSSVLARSIQSAKAASTLEVSFEDQSISFDEIQDDHEFGS